MTTGNSIIEHIDNIRFFQQCEIGSVDLPVWHRKEILLEHNSYKIAVQKTTVGAYSKNDLVLYMQHMTNFMNSLSEPPTEEELCSAIDFYTKLDMNVLWRDFDEDKRVEIIIRHKSLRDLHNLSTAILRRDYKALVDHKKKMLFFASDKPPLYE